MLPPKAVAIMRFLNQKTVNQIVDMDNMLNCWGGKDDYEFSFIPEEPTTQLPIILDDSVIEKTQEPKSLTLSAGGLETSILASPKKVIIYVG